MPVEFRLLAEMRGRQLCSECLTNPPRPPEALPSLQGRKPHSQTENAECTSAIQALCVCLCSLLHLSLLSLSSSHALLGPLISHFS